MIINLLESASVTSIDFILDMMTAFIPESDKDELVNEVMVQDKVLWAFEENGFILTTEYPAYIFINGIIGINLYTTENLAKFSSHFDKPIVAKPISKSRDRLMRKIGFTNFTQGELIWEAPAQVNR